MEEENKYNLDKDFIISKIIEHDLLKVDTNSDNTVTISVDIDFEEFKKLIKK